MPPPPPPPSVWLAVAVLLVQAAALVLPLADAADQAARGLPNCATTCGDVPVPYPFGLGAGCYHSPGFNLTCDTSQAAPRLLLGTGAFQVLDISLANATVRAARTGGVNISLGDGRGVWRGLPDPGPYGLKDDANELVVVGGCDVLAQLTGASPGRSNITISGCASFCPGTSPDSATTLSVTDGRCTGVGCCQMPIGIGCPAYDVQLRRLDPSRPLPPGTNWPPLVLVSEQGWIRKAAASTRGAPLPVNLHETSVPVLLSWAIAAAALGRNKTPPANSTCPGDAARSACKSRHSSCRNIYTAARSGYVCDCQDGYDGNPYLTDGCQDINECERPEEYVCFGECTNLPGTFQCRCPPRTHDDHTQRHGCVRSSSPGFSISIGIGVASGAGLILLVLVGIFIARKLLLITFN